MTTQQAIEALHALPRLGQGAPGLARMQNLMDHLGNPEKDLQCIHIAGTNGKGSLAAMTSSILTAAGYKTGLTISPYVVDFRERFQIDGEMIPPRTLANLAQKVLDAIDAIEKETSTRPLCYMANCVHPDVLHQALLHPRNDTPLVRQRFQGIQANAANLSPEELDGCDHLISSSPEELADRLMTLLWDFPLKICGGCCGTNQQHMHRFAEMLAYRRDNKAW